MIIMIIPGDDYTDDMMMISWIPTTRVTVERVRNQYISMLERYLTNRHGYIIRHGWGENVRQQIFFVSETSIPRLEMYSICSFSIYRSALEWSPKHSSASCGPSCVSYSFGNGCFQLNIVKP